MDQPYSFLADCLSKFHTASEPIQALLIVALALTVLGVTGLMTRAAVEIVAIRHRGRGRFATAAIMPPDRFINSTAVMPGLDPGTHDFLPAPSQERRGWPGRARP